MGHDLQAILPLIFWIDNHLKVQKVIFLINWERKKNNHDPESHKLMWIIDKSVIFYFWPLLEMYNWAKLPHPWPSPMLPWSSCQIVVVWTIMTLIGSNILMLGPQFIKLGRLRKHDFVKGVVSLVCGVRFPKPMWLPLALSPSAL